MSTLVMRELIRAGAEITCYINALKMPEELAQKKGYAEVVEVVRTKFGRNEVLGPREKDLLVSKPDREQEIASRVSRGFIWPSIDERYTYDEPANEGDNQEDLSKKREEKRNSPGTILRFINAELGRLQARQTLQTRALVQQDQDHVAISMRSSPKHHARRNHRRDNTAASAPPGGGPEPGAATQPRAGEQHGPATTAAAAAEYLDEAAETADAHLRLSGWQHIIAKLVRLEEDAMRARTSRQATTENATSPGRKSDILFSQSRVLSTFSRATVVFVHIIQLPVIGSVAGTFFLCILGWMLYQKFGVNGSVGKDGKKK
ncbi:hypothetical protein QBC33DRAFT_570182 [Phialemonium atrogriseum]|uniref:Uncharacterized protein n=1 Tax=Phialemonium atrogriseum TaxID=1093897 RepID=A0AAJ0C1X4_9PEZI|nr:uncharacterized protein QBC33DRAFT_570182 [Phialemonium atrogriseum]KAK1767224.1 hypothetical protein QBC33DRAFT_570182 [Phialemonium atrogriseum]